MLNPGNPPGQIRTIRLIYFMAGMGVSAWAIIVPFTKIRFALNDATLGLILLAPGLGGILVMPLAGLLMKHTGSKPVLLGFGIAFGILLPLLSIAPTPEIFTVLLFFYGVAFGGIDVAMNAQAVVVEGRSGRLLMSSFHALFSLGSLGVALATSFLLDLGISNAVSSLLCGAGIFAVLSQFRHLVPPSEDLSSDGPALALPNRATFVLGLCCLTCFLTEGAVTDWSTILLRFSRHAPLAVAPFGYAGFAVAMATARLTGDAVAMRIGQARLMQAGCVLAGLGMLVAATAPWLWLDVAGFAAVGLGTGNIAPLVLSAAARVPGMSPTTSTPAVVGLGYAGFLLGPVIIGCIANAVTLAFAMGLVAVLLFTASFASRAVAPDRA
jgi:MFS family permease